MTLCVGTLISILTLDALCRTDNLGVVCSGVRVDDGVVCVRRGWEVLGQNETLSGQREGTGASPPILQTVWKYTTKLETKVGGCRVERKSLLFLNYLQLGKSWTHLRKLFYL